MIRYRKFFKVAGVTFEGRQYVINDMNKDDVVYLQAEPDNKYDPKAIAVMLKQRPLETTGDLKIGYIAKDRTADVHQMMNQDNFECHIDEITGGFQTVEGIASYGVTLRLEASYHADKY